MRQHKVIIAALLLGISAAGGWCVRGAAASASGQAAVAEIPVPPPPMGWSSWNSFSNEIDSNIAMAQAKAMVSTGMKARGYQYVNIDEGWWLGERDAQGNIVVDPAQWPALEPGERAGDMANIVKFIHSLGLKAGIYTDAGEAGCSFYGPDLGPPKPHTGSEAHYEQDFLQFAKWGFDYVKVDWCGGHGENLDPALQYGQVARAIRRAEALTGHRLFFSICDWGVNSPWTWAPGIGGVTADIWRTSGDIVAPIVANSPNANRQASFPGMLGNFDKGIHPEAQHTGFYNDPDMMVLGMPALSDAENRVHMTLWAISGAPLLVGADLTTLSPASLSTLTNPEVLAVDQDPLGLQCAKVSDASGLQVWSKRLAQLGRTDSRRAVVLLNRTASAAPVTVRWSDLGLDSDSATVRDLWRRQDLGTPANSFSATVPATDALMLLVTGHEQPGVRYPAADGVQGTPAVSSAFCTEKEKSWVFHGVQSAGSNAWIQIAYENPQDSPSFAEFRTNGELETLIAFPSTGKGRMGSITIAAALKHRSQGNDLTLLAAGGGSLTVDSITVIPGSK